MINITDPVILLGAQEIITDGYARSHSTDLLTSVKQRTDGSVSFKLDGVDYSATFERAHTHEVFIRNAKELNILEVA